MKLRIFHIPQVPGPAFYEFVDSPTEGLKFMNLLAEYDKFQLDNRIKPDYCNASGLEQDGLEGWEDWCDEDGCPLDEYCLVEGRLTYKYW